MMAISYSLFITFIVAGVSIALSKLNDGADLASSSNTPCTSVAKKSPTFDARMAKGAIYQMLSESEIDLVVKWMITSSGLGIVAYDEAELNQNYIMKIDAAEPPKADAVAYLDGLGPKPPRQAMVRVNMGALSTPCIREYRVGPLPISPKTSLTPVEYGGIYDIPYNAKMLDTKDFDPFDVLVLKTFKDIKAEMLDSYGTTYEDPCTRDNCLMYVDTAPRGPLRHESIWFVYDIEAEYANVVGLTMSFDVGGVDISKWKLLLITYNGFSFTSTAAFKAAYNNPAWAVNKIPHRPLLNHIKASLYGEEWSTLKKAPNSKGIQVLRSSKTRLNSDIPAPQIMEPGGSRYVVQSNHVEYLGWSFFIAHNVETGLKLMDLRYRDTKVAYEVGLAEAAALYSGFNDVIQASTVYLDTAWGLGTCIAESIAGVDCPATGKLLDVTFLEDSGTSTTKKGVICIFESDDQIPLRKHYFAGDERYTSYGGLARSSLIIRVQLPVYNYDYIIDHVFYPNGAMEVRAVTSGYLQATWTSSTLANEARDYSPQVHENVAGTLHDHFFSFKIDLDVGKIKNKLVKKEITAVSVTPQDLTGKAYKDTLSCFAVASDYMTKKIVSTTITNETGFTITPDKPTKLTVVEGAETNSWGSTKGYQVQINGVSQNIVANSKAHRAVSFTKHSLIATKRHENEPRITSIYDQGDTTGTVMPTGKPLVDADRLLQDNESIVDEDIVLWANFGVHHIPHAEDIPVTHTVGNSGSIFLIPMNMFDYDDSMDLSNSVYSDNSCVDSKAPVKSKSKSKPSPKCNYAFDLKTGAKDLCQKLTYSPPGSNL